jgi:hypothetical protein
MSWDELLSIVRTDRAEQAANRAGPPSACPHDGEPLKTDLEGKLRCPAGDWVWDNGPVTW